MQIKIAERFKPFSHVPGVRAALPWSPIDVVAFPTKLVIGTQELLLGVTGPVKNFTLIQDLERGEIRVFGTPREGYYEFLIRQGEWILSRCQEKGLSINGERFQRGSKGKVTGAFEPKKELERLSLGCHKEQEFAKIAKRNNLAEILPFWFFLGQQLPSSQGTLPDLPLDQLFAASFSDLFYPSFANQQHLGMNMVGATGDPRIILTQGAKLIRKRFFQREGNRFSFLLQNPFPSGRFIDIVEKGWGRIHFEWTKHQMRRCIFESEQEGEIFFVFPKELESCRLRFSPQEKGKVFQLQSPIFVQKGQKILLDRFYK